MTIFIIKCYWRHKNIQIMSCVMCTCMKMRSKGGFLYKIPGLHLVIEEVLPGCSVAQWLEQPSSY